MSQHPDCDVLIIGAGVAGALAAAKLAAAGVHVILVDAGPAVDRGKAVERFRAAAAHTPESAYAPNAYAPRPTTQDPGAYYVQLGPEPFGSTYERQVGGTTWHWLGTALRMLPSDFALRTHHGVGVDWPLSYAELEHWYGRAEDELGVSGTPQAADPPRSKPYPMPGLPLSYADRHVDAGARRIGLRMAPTPQARNSVARRGRPACCGNSSCIPICPIGAKYDATVHVTEAQGNGARLMTSAVARRVSVKPGRVSVRLVRPDRSEVTVTGRTLVLAAHAVETPKLMLLSELGNAHGLVGRFLMDHPIQLSWALARESIKPFRGPLSTGGIESLRDGPFRGRRAAFRIEVGNDGWAFPVGDVTSQARAAAADGPLGKDGLRALGDRLSRELRFAALAEPLPERENRVSLSAHRDAIGIPRPALSYRVSGYAKAGLDAARAVHGRLFAAMGAEDVHHAGTPVGAGHIMGTCRMGDDPRTSVVDAHLRVHGHANCFVLGSSVFPSVGTANPTLTIAALSLRAVEDVRASLAS